MSTPRSLFLASLTIWSCVVVTRPASAQSRPPEFLTAIPASPAQIYLGASSDKVQTPGNLRDLGVALLSAMNDKGQAQDGFALDASVWNLVPGFDLPLARYRTSAIRYALGNLQASVSTVRTSGEEGNLRGAIGVKTVLIDRGDPMLDRDLTRRLAEGLRSCRPEQPGAGQNVACVDSVTADIIGAHALEKWNATQLAAAAAWGVVFPNAQLSRGAYEGLNAWLTGAFGIGAKAQVIGQATFKTRGAIDTIPGFRAMNLGARFVFGTGTFNGFGEYLREWRSPDEQPGTMTLDRNVGGWSAGVEFRVNPNIWISTGLGTRLDALDAPDRVVVLANIKWAVTSASRMRKLGTQDRGVTAISTLEH